MNNLLCNIHDTESLMLLSSFACIEEEQTMKHNNDAGDSSSTFMKIQHLEEAALSMDSFKMLSKPAKSKNVCQIFDNTGWQQPP